MLDHFEPDDPSKYIITADRGYESYDLIFHCECKKLFYVFRVKAPSSPKSILSTYKHELPDEQEEFDIVIKRFFTGKRNKIMKEQSQVYFYIHPDSVLSQQPCRVPCAEEFIAGSGIYTGTHA